MTTIIDTSGQRSGWFNPEEPPTAEDGSVNAAVVREMTKREARAVQGTTAAVAARAETEHAERVVAAEASTAARVAAGGGVEIATELRGELGAEVARALALDTIDAAARKVRARIDGEIAEIRAQMEATAQQQHRARLLSSAWDAAAAKQRVPELLAPHLHWSQHERPQGNPDLLAIVYNEELNADHARRRRDRVRDRLADVEAIIVREATEALAQAGRAADVLAEAGLSVSATAQDVLNARDLTVAEAWQTWQASAARWSEIQSARRWVAVALAYGFSKSHPDQLRPAGLGGLKLNTTTAEIAETEADAWRSQWVGVAMSTYVVGASAALAWWLSNGRPAPAGVGASTQDGGLR